MSDHSFIMYAGAIAVGLRGIGYAIDALDRALDDEWWRSLGNAWAALGCAIIAYHVWIAAGR